MKNIVIVGGGTAGWMSALAISTRHPDKRVVVIDSSVVGPIGVGESVTGVLLGFVLDPLHGLSLGEFFRRTGATFKMGIWYKDWHGPGTEYLGPIDSPAKYFRHGYDTVLEEFFAAATAEGVRLGEAQLYSQLMRKGRTDHFRNADGTINTSISYASCQFDALKFAEWIQEVAKKRPNVRHYDDVVESFSQDPATGHVTAVHTAQKREIEGDLFVDCTGFHRLLFARAYQPRWRSYADYIKVDSAIPRVVPFPAGEPMPNYTQATAMPNGWMWQIPTQSRLGRGYVFSSRYASDEQAIAEFRAAGVDVGEEPRILRFSPGRFENQWLGNVCAIGLSGVFSEPLEASTIHGMTVQIKLLTDLFLPYCTRESMPVLSRQYNRLVGAAYDDYVDFISFHYHTGRCDTEFWRDYQKPESITPRNRERMEKWKYAYPCREDFEPTHTQLAILTTGMVVWMPMLCGMGLLRPENARRLVAMSRHKKWMQENVASYVQTRDHIVARGLSQAEAIAYFSALP